LLNFFRARLVDAIHHTTRSKDRNSESKCAKIHARVTFRPVSGAQVDAARRGLCHAT
jgi:hypothetical protein